MVVTDFRNNHYVPQWYQRRFLPQGCREKKFHYLDLSPERRVSGHKTYTRAALMRWGPPRCFVQRDLYTTRIGQWISTGIERVFFGRADLAGKAAVEYFAKFAHPSVNGRALEDILVYMTLQKLRTPKGLEFLAGADQGTDKNAVLLVMQRLQQMFCATWSECVWSIVDASLSGTKFIVSDHPVTVYNAGCFPQSTYCRGDKDPDIRLSGTHTLFPLSLDKLLVLTNLSWVRNPYANPLLPRPNPALFRQAMFNFTSIQTGRMLEEVEVREINFIIKQRARRYVAAAEEEWLFPERSVPTQHWDRFGNGYLLMPDPRSVTFATGTFVGYSHGRSEGFDEYGRRLTGSDDPAEKRRKEEWNAHLAFQGEFARVFGAKRRGRAFEFGRLADEEDSPDFHKYHLNLEGKYKPLGAGRRHRRR